MALWFYRGLRRGMVTTRYPEAIDLWADQLPSPPAFHSERLTTELADRLVRGCAANALSREDHQLVIDAGRCTGCGRCVELGEGVAVASDEFLLATGDRGALIKRVPIRRDRKLRDARR
ncbi:MAG: 4Fe-4S binding protein [Solirubrobacteraceae bacterium]